MTEHAAIPDPAAVPPDELCDWWVRFGSDLNSQVWRIKRAVEEHVRQVTTVVTPSGTLEAQSAGWEWDDKAVAIACPAVVTAASVTFHGPISDVERALSLVTEEVPGLDFEVGHTIDKRKAGTLANAGGEIGEALRDCRVPKPAKVVIR